MHRYSVRFSRLPPLRCELRSDRPKRRTVALRASVGSTEVTVCLRSSTLTTPCARAPRRYAEATNFPIGIARSWSWAIGSPSCSLGSSTSRGRRSGYAKAPHFGQRAPTAPADLFPQGMRAQVPAAALEPALLPVPAMPAGGPPVAGSAAASPSSPARPGQRPACPGRTSAPSARQVRASDCWETGSYAGAWSRGGAERGHN
jgi:hypothetical protein